MAKVPTKEQIQVELNVLKSLHTRIPEYSAFGDNNWLAAQAAIDVIENKLDENELYDKYDENSDGHSQNILDAARDTYDWITGQLDEPWSAGWEF